MTTLPHHFSEYSEDEWYYSLERNLKLSFSKARKDQDAAFLDFGPEFLDIDTPMSSLVRIHQQLDGIGQIRFENAILRGVASFSPCWHTYDAFTTLMYAIGRFHIVSGIDVIANIISEREEWLKQYPHLRSDVIAVLMSFPTETQAANAVQKLLDARKLDPLQIYTALEILIPAQPTQWAQLIVRNLPHLDRAVRYEHPSLQIQGIALLSDEMARLVKYQLSKFSAPNIVIGLKNLNQYLISNNLYLAYDHPVRLLLEHLLCAANSPFLIQRDNELKIEFIASSNNPADPLCILPSDDSLDRVAFIWEALCSANHKIQQVDTLPLEDGSSAESLLGYKFSDAHNDLRFLQRNVA